MTAVPAVPGVTALVTRVIVPAVLAVVNGVFVVTGVVAVVNGVLVVTGVVAVVTGVVAVVTVVVETGLVVFSHQDPPEVGRKRRSRRLLLTTNTLENAMAAPASMGLSSPAAAMGRAATL